LWHFQRKLTANSLFSMLVKILRPVNIWLSYRPQSWLSNALCVPGHCPAERWRNRQIPWVWL